MSVISRLTRGQMPISMLHGKRYNELNKELENDPIMGMPSDEMLSQYSFGKNFKTIITGREAWKEGPPINVEIACYTDGSKTEKGVGAEIYITKPKIKVSSSLGKKMTIFQAETAAIRHCAEELLRQEFKEKTIEIYSDRQAAIKAISSMQVNSKLVWNCPEKLQELGSQNRLSLAWVPGHTGFNGNEEADSLAREGARCSPIAIAKIHGVPTESE
ncbi:uncharacterized protein [Leptinotarsa decemlineata]|uniref:uncharacterized protein n=1 Tax=Leptinotarsa decemlineata TaxID=7539 RepID=UPI003D30C91A